jgi:hypothetical protein
MTAVTEVARLDGCPIRPGVAVTPPTVASRSFASLGRNRRIAGSAPRRIGGSCPSTSILIKLTRSIRPCASRESIDRIGTDSAWAAEKSQGRCGCSKWRRAGRYRPAPSDARRCWSIRDSGGYCRPSPDYPIGRVLCIDVVLLVSVEPLDQRRQHEIEERLRRCD